jgi:hypothetical protein
MNLRDLTHNTLFIIPKGTRIRIMDPSPDGLPYDAVVTEDIRKFSTTNTVQVDDETVARWKAHAEKK